MTEDRRESPDSADARDTGTEEVVDPGRRKALGRLAYTAPAVAMLTVVSTDAVAQSGGDPPPPPPPPVPPPASP